MTEADAVYAFFAAFAVTALLTPLTARLARRVGAVDQPKERGLGAGSTPLLGGLAVLGGAVVIAFVGALDDRFDLPPGAKLAGQIVAAAIPVAAGVEVTNITLPFIGAVNF